MTYYKMLLIISSVLAVIFFGCSDDQVVQQPAPGSDQSLVSKIEGNSAAVISELEELTKIADAPDGGVGHWVEGGYVELPAGSVDALADAIAAAGENGVVLVRSGLHTESDAVVIPHAVQIVGEHGAVMQMTSDPYTAYPGLLDPALDVNAPNGRVLIWGLEIVSSSAIGGTAILIEHSPNTIVGKNTIRGFEQGIFAHYADDTRIVLNTIEASAAWQTGEIPESGGITIANGNHAGIMGNNVSFGLFGVFGSDTAGVYMKNDTHDGYIGLILCKVPSGGLYVPDGEDAGAQSSACQYLVRKNRSTNNLAEGFLVIDGSHNNVLVDNYAFDNGTYGVELAGDSYRFGFFTPACFDNVAVIPNSVVVKNCGNDNLVWGGILVDNEQDPCY